VLCRNFSPRIHHLCITAVCIVILFLQSDAAQKKPSQRPPSKKPVPAARAKIAVPGANYQSRLMKFVDSTLFKDTSYLRLKAGVDAFRSNDFAAAQKQLSRMVQACSTFAPVYWDLTADIFMSLGKPDSALDAYRAALSCALPQRYRNELEGKAADVLRENQVDVSKYPWALEWYKPVSTTLRDARLVWLDSLISRRDYANLDSASSLLLDSASGAVQCDIANLLNSGVAPDSLLSTRVHFGLAQAFYSCRDYAETMRRLDLVSQRADFSSTVLAGNYQYLRGMTLYRMGKDRDAIDWLNKFAKRNAPSQEMVMTMARAYRNLRDQAKSDEWYDKYAELFRRDTKTQDVLWYRAWQNEESNRFDAARGFYQEIIDRFPRSARAKEARFRIGLVYYRQKAYDSAASGFSRFLEKSPPANLINAGWFWKSVCNFRLHQMDSADQIWKNIITDDPFGYYAYRSREMLLLQGDTLARIRIDTTVFLDSLRHRFDSLSEDTAKSLMPVDSQSLRAALFLAASGLPDKAGYYLESVEMEYPSDLRLQLDLSLLYGLIGNAAYSYRTARRFFWRLSSEERLRVPAIALSLMYPKWFMHYVDPYAISYGVDPMLMYAVMRQESIFNPDIVSPVGAIGLMQIMPATGKEIAAGMGEKFVKDSLYIAATNVRYGAYYLRQLLDQFDGNVTLAVASYNGGPHNAAKWRDINSFDGFNLFVEGVGFAETRDYVKKVLANYWTYTLLNQSNAYNSLVFRWMSGE
jgi:tetratricopeptide (TPR) repeat protein